MSETKVPNGYLEHLDLRLTAKSRNEKSEDEAIKRIQHVLSEVGMELMRVRELNGPSRIELSLELSKLYASESDERALLQDTIMLTLLENGAVSLDEFLKYIEKWQLALGVESEIYTQNMEVLKSSRNNS